MLIGLPDLLKSRHGDVNIKIAKRNLESYFLYSSASLIIGSFRLDYEYEIEYEYDFSILVFRLHIITTHTHFIP